MTNERETIAALQAEVATLRARVAELEQEVTRCRITVPEQAKLLQSFLDNLPAIIFAKDRQGRFLLNNQQFLNTYQLDVDSIIGQTLYDLFPRETADRMWNSEKAVFETGEPVHVELQVPEPDGLHTRMTIKFPIHDTHGNIYAVGGIATDITERRQAEEEVRVFKALAEFAPDAIGIAATDGTITYANPAFRAMFGYGDNIIGMSNMLVFTEEEQQQRVPGVIEEVLRLGSWTGRLTGQHKGGHTIPLHLSAFLIADEDGRPQAMPAILRDISEQERQAQAVQSSEERLRAIIEKIPVGVCITTQEQHFEYVNPAYCEIYGYAPEELIGNPFTMVVPEENRPLMRALHDKFVEEGTEIRGEWTVVRKDGTPLTILADAAAITGEDGNPRKVTFVMDITPLKQAEQERQLLQEQIIEAQQAAIRELSTPLIPLSDSVVLMPLIGSIDTNRAQQVMEALLEGIAMHQADIAILDITGVSVVDTQVANALIQSAQAVRLLGAQVILTGIGPAMAQTLVHLGADLSSIQTRGSLQRAIIDALRG